MENEIDYKKMCELILDDYNEERQAFSNYRTREYRYSYNENKVRLITLDDYQQRYIKECTDYKKLLAEIESVYKQSIEKLKNQFGVK